MEKRDCSTALCRDTVQVAICMHIRLQKRVLIDQIPSYGVTMATTISGIGV